MSEKATFRSVLSEGTRALGSAWILYPPKEWIDQLMGLDTIKGVVLSEKDDVLATAYPGQIGWIDWTLMDVKLPDEKANALLAFRSMPAVPLSVMRRLLQVGVRRIGFLSTADGQFYTRPVPVQLVHRIVDVLVSRAQTLVRKLLLAAGWDRAIGGTRIKDTEAASEADWERAFGRIDWHGPSILSADEIMPRKIMLVTGSLATGGSERQVTYTALGLKARGHDVTVLVTDLQGPKSFFLPKLEQAGVRVVELPSAPNFDSPLRAPLLAGDIDSMTDGFDGFTDEMARYLTCFVAEKPAVVHTWLDWPNVAAGLAAVAAGVPRIVAGGRSLPPTHFAFFRTFMRPGYRQLIRSERVSLINNSRAGADEYADWIGTDRANIRTVANAIDPAEHTAADLDRVAAFRAKYELPEGTPVLGSIFRLMPEKRPELWLAIAAKAAAARPDLRFVLVGGGPEMDAVIEQSMTTGLFDKLILTGETRDVITPLAVMSCFLLTSRVEGLPNVLIEAQLSGVPVVTSKVGGAPEALEPEGPGAVIDSDEPGPYAEAILSILAAPQALEVAHRSLPVRTLDRFSPDRMIDATLAVYGLAAEPPARART